MDHVRTHSAGLIVAFPDPSSRPRRVVSPDEPRGEILLFTGVRYERMEADDSGPRPAVSDGHSRRRRRRS
jgi:hypothetical protein